MDYKLLLQDISEHYFSFLPSIINEDKTFILNHTSLRMKIKDLGSKTKKKHRLFIEGVIIWGRLIKTYDQNPLSNREKIGYILHSPEVIFEEEPDLYEKILERINEAIEEPKKPFKRLSDILMYPEEEPKYFEVPKELTFGKLVYITITFLSYEHFPNMKFNSLVPIIIAPSITKEIAIIPQKYWSNTYIDYLKS